MRSDMLRRFVGAVVLAVGVGLSGSAVARGVEAEPPVAVGDALAISPGVEVRPGTAGAYAALSGAALPVAVGDGVRTDATGYAEVAYLDGSRTRLDVNTEFEVVERVDNAGVSSTRTSMALGRTWHRVESLGQAGGEFVVETSQATATATGTAFGAQCPTVGACTFFVVEGSIRLTLLDGTVIDLVAPSALSVVDGAAGAVVSLPYGGVFGDPWLLDNATRDVEAGFVDPATMYSEHGPLFGSLSGTFTGTRTVTESTCEGQCPPSQPLVGDVADRTYTFAIDCTAGIPCTGTAETQYIFNDEERHEFVPMTFDGTAYSWSIATSNPSCHWDDDGDGVFERTTGNIDLTITWTMTSSAAEIRDAAWQATALQGEARAHNVLTEIGGCPDEGSWTVSDNTGTISVSR